MIFFCFFLSFFLATSVDAAESITLKQAELLAIENNEGLKALRADVEAGRQQYLQSVSGYLPSVAIEGKIARAEEPAFYGEKQAHSEKLGVSQAILFSDVYYGIKKKKLNFEALQVKERKKRNSLLFQLRKAYYLVILFKDEVEVQRENTGVLLEALRREQNELLLGESTSFEVNQSKVILTNAMSALYESEKDLKIARNKLMRLLGVSSEREVELSEVCIPVESVQEIKEKLSLFKTFKEKEKGEKGLLDFEAFLKGGQSRFQAGRDIYSKEEIDFWEKLSVKNRFDIHLKKMEKRSAFEYLKEKRAEYLPKVSAFASYETISSKQRPLLGGYDNWHFGLQFSWSLFDGFARERRICEARCFLNSLEWEHQSLVESAKMEVRNEICEMEEALLSYYATHETMSLAKEAIEQAKAKRYVGSITFLEYRDVLSSYKESKQNFNRAAYRLLISYYALRYLAGLE